MSATEKRLRAKAEEDQDIAWALREIDKLRAAVRTAGSHTASANTILEKSIR